MQPSRQQLIQLMIDGLEPKISLFKVEQHSGAWQVAAPGNATAVLYRVLHGECYLHLEQGQPVLLQAGDGVFFFAESGSQLKSSADTQQATLQTLHPAQDKQESAVGLARFCFELNGPLATTLISSFPEQLLLNKSHGPISAIGPLLDLLSAELLDSSVYDAPLVGRLTQLLFFYLLRDSANHFDSTRGLCALACHPRFSVLINSMLESPAESWLVNDMAAHLHMSRASFYKYFMEVSDFPPAQLIQQLRIQLAMQKLRMGDSIGCVSEAVGYQSQATFSRVFSRLIGVQPSLWQQQLKAV